MLVPRNVALGDSSAYNYASGRLDHQTYFKSIRVEHAHLEAVVLDRLLAAWFDEAQADWHPDRRASLYGAWRDSLVHDRGLGILCRLPDLSERIRELPDETEAALLRATAQLGLAAEMLEDWFDALLLRDAEVFDDRGRVDIEFEFG